LAPCSKEGTASFPELSLVFSAQCILRRQQRSIAKTIYRANLYADSGCIAIEALELFLYIKEKVCAVVVLEIAV
jgi:hypothetical protein